MHRLFVSLLALPLLSALGCAASTAESTTPERAARAKVTRSAKTAKVEAETLAADSLRAGDYATFAFSGSFRSKPITLTQRVIEREGDTLVVDYTLAESGRVVDSLRIVRTVEGSILDVSRVREDGTIDSVPLAAFEQLLAQTAAAADHNEALLDEQDALVRAGDRELEVKRTTFRVRIGEREGTLATLTQDGFGWGDVGGELVTESGELVYRAELVAIGSDADEAYADETTTAALR